MTRIDHRRSLYQHHFAISFQQAISDKGRQRQSKEIDCRSTKNLPKIQQSGRCNTEIRRRGLESKNDEIVSLIHVGPSSQVVNNLRA